MKKYRKPVSLVEIETKNASAKGGDFGGGFTKGFMGGIKLDKQSFEVENIKVVKAE